LNGVTTPKNGDFYSLGASRQLASTAIPDYLIGEFNGGSAADKYNWNGHRLSTRAVTRGVLREVRRNTLSGPLNITFVKKY
jgi:hypothetical protein